MVEQEQGNASLAMLSTVFGILYSFMLGLTFINVHLSHQTAAAAAEAGALATTGVLQDVFIEDIQTTAYRKLDELMQRIEADAKWAEGKEQEAIERNTVPSMLREELLAGRRGQQVSMIALLRYEPFFSEQELGESLYRAFQRHAVQLIIPQVKKYLADNGASGGGSIRFPVYGRIEVQTEKELKGPLFESWLKGRIRSVGGRGYALYIEELDGQGIRYDLSGLPVWQVNFE